MKKRLAALLLLLPIITVIGCNKNIASFSNAEQISMDNKTQIDNEMTVQEKDLDDMNKPEQNDTIDNPTELDTDFEIQDEIITDESSSIETKQETAAPEIYNVEAYVLERDGNSILVDTENPEGRRFSQEGKDRAVKFDISNAKIEIKRTPEEEMLDLPSAIRTGITVYMEYYVENESNIVTFVETNALEREFFDVTLPEGMQMVLGDVVSIDANKLTIKTYGDELEVYDIGNAVMEGVTEIILDELIYVEFYRKGEENIATYIAQR